MTNTEKSWIVGLCRHQHLHVARQELRKQGFGIRLPKFYRHHTHPDFGSARMGLRFGSRYIFICADLEAGEIAPINHTRGMDDTNRGQAVIGTWAGESFRPHVLRPKYLTFLDDLQEAEFAEAVASKAPEPRPDLVPGDVVVIVGDRGRLGYGQEGRFEEAHRDKAMVFCGQLRITVDLCDLKKVEQPEKKRAA
jgi:hypothetical protein